MCMSDVVKKLSALERLYGEAYFKDEETPKR